MANDQARYHTDDAARQGLFAAVSDSDDGVEVVSLVPNKAEMFGAEFIIAVNLKHPLRFLRRLAVAHEYGGAVARVRFVDDFHAIVTRVGLKHFRRGILRTVVQYANAVVYPHTIEDPNPVVNDFADALRLVVHRHDNFEIVHG